MTYEELRKVHQDKINALPLKFAFSNQQFSEAMAEWGLTPDDTDKIYKFSSFGGIYLRSDAELIHQTFKSIDEEMENAMKGDEFCISAIEYELRNHEYGLTYDPDEALESLDLSLEDERTQRLFPIAEKRYLATVKD
jgi:hypothetical protein